LYVPFLKIVFQSQFQLRHTYVVEISQPSPMSHLATRCSFAHPNVVSVNSAQLCCSISDSTVKVISWQRAISLLFLEIEVLEE